MVGRDVVRLVTLAAGKVDLVAGVGDVGRSGTDVFVVRVSRAQTVTVNAADLRAEVSDGKFLSNEGHVTDVAAGVGTEGIVHRRLLRLPDGTARGHRREEDGDAARDRLHTRSQ